MQVIREDTTMIESSGAIASQVKPSDEELDVYGLTHVGNVRETNQDHFLITSLRREVKVLHSSLPGSVGWSSSERLALLAVVADGVGSSVMGEEASRLAVRGIMAYVLECMNCYYTMGASDDETFTRALNAAALRVHEDVTRESAEGPPEGRNMATTLTVWLGVWPRAYLLQVGDSRCYLYRDGKLRQLSRDQTVAQEMVDVGVFTPEDAVRSPLAHVLSSAIGGSEAAPIITRLEQDWDEVGLLCSDGLTKHVTDERIAERLRTMTSSKQACEALLQDALDGGGSDNITVVIGRPMRRKGGPAPQ